MSLITWYAISVLLLCVNMTLNARLLIVCGTFGAQWNSEDGITW